jgi:DnaK suppressor protein
MNRKTRIDYGNEALVTDEERSHSRYDDLHRMLHARRDHIRMALDGRIRDARADALWGGRLNEVFDVVESSEADIQADIELALLQMKSETLKQMDDAVARLERGDYGTCGECGEDMAEKRLRALPFAVRCKNCEEARELAAQRQRRQPTGSSLFLDI